MSDYTGIAREIRNALSISVFSAILFLVGVVLISHPGRPGQQTLDTTTSTSTTPSSNAPEPPASSAPATRSRSLDCVAGEDEHKFAQQPTTTEVTRSTNDVVPPAGHNGGVPVLCYHYLRAETTPLRFVKILGALFLNLPLLEDMDVWTQTASSFDKQVTYLKENGYESVDLSDLRDWQRGRKKLPPKPVVITFDDGDRSVLEFGYPILKRHGFKATLFVVTSRVGQTWERVECLDWSDLEMLEQSGVFSIQSHTHDLHRKVKTSEGTIPVFVAASAGIHTPTGDPSWSSLVSEDLRTSRELIEKHVGGDVEFLAWPYGFGDARLDSVAVAAGFYGLCTLEYGRNGPYGIVYKTEPPPPTRAGFGFPLGVDGLASRPPGVSIPHRPMASRSRWERFEIKRFTITARTSMRGFKQMLEE